LIELPFAADELWIGEMRGVVVAGEPLLVIRLDEQICVYRDRCPHQGHPLSEGSLDGGVVTCPRHHHSFAADSGAGINPPRPCLNGVASRIEAGRIFVELEPGERTP
jgi:nitrite reductase/ring-hydroxylating ferredoxin subunit